MNDLKINHKGRQSEPGEIREGMGALDHQIIAIWYAEWHTPKRQQSSRRRCSFGGSPDRVQNVLSTRRALLPVPRSSSGPGFSSQLYLKNREYEALLGFLAGLALLIWKATS